MVHRPSLRSVGSGTGPDPPSALFQRLSAEYPDLSRRVVGEVLSRVSGAAWESAPDPKDFGRLDTAACALLDAIRARAAGAARRTGRSESIEVVAVHPGQNDVPSASFEAGDLRAALDPVHEPHAPSRVERLATAIEARAQVLGVAMSASLLCQAAMAQLGVAAVAISLPGTLVTSQTIGVAGDLARPLEELQVVLDEGPSRDGLAYGAALLVEDLTALQQQARWPLYAPMATDQGARAQVVLPMQVGAARFGVFVLYLDRVGGLRPEELGDARVFGEVALGWLIDDVAGGFPGADAGARTREPFLDDRPEIHQATGMVSVQLGVDLSTALLRLRARAYADDRLLSDLAADVVARTLRFRPDGDAPDAREVEEI